MYNKAKKVVSNALRYYVRMFTELKILPNGMFRLVRGLNTESKEVELGRCMRECDGKLCFSEKKRGKVWTDYIERNMNEENDWIMMWKEMQ